MPIVKPTKFPEWANNDVVNPTTSQNNVVEPAQAIKDLGWDYNEKPPRQYFNWLGRLTNAWMEWFDQQETKVEGIVDIGSYDDYPNHGLAAASNPFTVVRKFSGNAIIQVHFKFVSNVSIDYIKIPFSPGDLVKPRNYLTGYIDDEYLHSCQVVRYLPSSPDYEPVSNIYAKLTYESNVTQMLIGNSELEFQLPVTESFSTYGFAYGVNVNMCVKCYG